MIQITFHYRYRKQIILGLLSLTFITLLTILCLNYFFKNSKPKKETIIKELKEESVEKEEKEEDIYKVDIKGQVISPGIYTMPATSRVIDVIEKAGGLAENANTTVLNLSKKITDEMVIIVYSNEEVANFSKTKELENIVQEKCEQKDSTSLKNDACICNASDSLTGLISLNTATLEELITLPGIGEAKAKDIIDYRSANGNFQTIEDIKNVPGIGESLFAKIKDYITI